MIIWLGLLILAGLLGGTAFVLLVGGLITYKLYQIMMGKID